jgi:phage terminase small subunit
MPVLKNPKHEIFVQHVIAGESAADAYKACGFKGKDARKRASDLRTKPEIKARIEELTGRITNNAVKRASAKLAIDKEMVLRMLVENIARGEKIKGGSSVVNRACELNR